ncbi:MAG TPA: DegV family protein [Lachnospiraceae bacterium]|nr:DegV family protein [Lachnospiraceae bacterium]
MEMIGVCTDSHSSITRDEAKRLGVRVLPMPFYIGENCYLEDVSISRAEFLEKLAGGADVSTSQPSPAAVMEFWDEALAEFEQIVYIPISSGLSGSCAAAQVLALEDKYDGRVFVVDNGRVSAPQHRAVLDALELVSEGYTAAEIKEILEASRAEMAVYIGVETLTYLKKGGRISPAAAALGTVLNIKPVLKLDVGTLDTFQKCRGFGKAKKVMLEAVHQDLETRWKEYHERGEAYLLAASSASPEATEEWVREIREEFPDMEVLCDELSLGVSCHIGPGGLGIACSCRPKRP